MSDYRRTDPFLEFLKEKMGKDVKSVETLADYGLTGNGLLVEWKGKLFEIMCYNTNAEKLKNSKYYSKLYKKAAKKLSDKDSNMDEVS